MFLQPIRLKALDYAVIAILLAYSASATITPICFVAIAREFSLSLSAGGGIEGVRSFLIFIMLFFSGFAAARFGKVRSLWAGSLMLALGFFAYSAAPSYRFILGATVCIGCGAGILEGLINPLVQDLHEGDSGRYMNITNAFWSVGVLSTVLVGGELLTRGVSWRPIIVFLGFLSLGASVLLFVLRDRQPRIRELDGKAVARSYVQCVRSRRFWVFASMMLLAGGVEGAFTFWSASYIQINFSAAPRMGGIGTACFAAGMMTMRFIGGFFVGQNRLRRLIILSASAGIVTGCAVPFVNSAALFFPVLFAAGATVACFWPSIQTYAVDRLGLDSTTVFILLSCAGIPGFGAVSFLMGGIGAAAGLTVSFFTVPVMLLLMLSVVFVERAFPPRCPAASGFGEGGRA